MKHHHSNNRLSFIVTTLLAVLPILPVACQQPSTQHPPALTSILGGTADQQLDGVGALVHVPVGTNFCSATLVDPRHAITAAHCVDNEPPETIALTFGSTPGETDSLRVAVDSIVIHPLYRADSFIHDVAVITLDQPVDTVQPISIPGAPIEQIDSDRSIILAGFGYDESGVDGVRRQAESTFEYWGTLMASALYSSDDGVGVCFGDSGGAAVVEENGQRRLIGVVANISAAHDGEDLCAQSYAITRLDRYLPFINNALGLTPPDCNKDNALCHCNDACRQDGSCDNSRCQQENCLFKYLCYASCPLDNTACFADCEAQTKPAQSAYFESLRACGADQCIFVTDDQLSNCLNQHCFTQLNDCFGSSHCALTGGDCDGKTACTEIDITGPVCIESENKQVGEECILDAPTVQCRDGATCVDQGNGPICRQQCDRTDQCPIGTACEQGLCSVPIAVVGAGCATSEPGAVRPPTLLKIMLNLVLPST